jgi:hypothetical protein
VLVKRDGTPWTGNTTPAQRVAPFHKILADLQERVTSETLADLPALAGGGWRSAREAASSSSEGLMDRDKVDAGDQDCGTSNPMYPRDNSDDDQIAQVGGDSEARHEQHAADDDAHWIQPPPLPPGVWSADGHIDVQTHVLIWKIGPVDTVSGHAYVITFLFHWTTGRALSQGTLCWLAGSFL